jgi:hypothetical protein
MSRRRMLILVVVLAVIGAGIAGFVWVGSYQPLVAGTGSRYPRGAKQTLGTQLMDVPFRQGKPFEVGLSLVNSGRFAVRVTGVEPWGPLPVQARWYMAGPQPNNGGFPRARQPFHAFDLRPGQEAFLSLRGIYRARCYPVRDGGTAWETGGFEVQYTFLWRTGRAEIALPMPLSVDPPRREDCAAVGQ